MLAAGAASAVNIKLAKSDRRALEIAAVARAAGVPLMIGCMAETARGLAASVHFALGTGFFRWAELDSDLLLAEDAAARRGAGWRPRPGDLPVRKNDLRPDGTGPCCCVILLKTFKEEAAT